MIGVSVKQLLSRRDLLVFAVLVCGFGAVHGATFPHTAKVTQVEDLTHDIKRVRFQLGEGDTLRFSPGQYVLLSVPDGFLREWNARHKTSHTKIARPYSFASSPSQLPRFEIIVKLAGPPPEKSVPPGVGSTYVHQLKIGDSVQFSDPVGELSASPDSGRPIILVAGSTGAAPFLSFLQSWFESDVPHKSRIYLFFGVRSRRDLFLHDTFRNWDRTRKDFVYVPALSNPQDGDAWSCETGYINAVLDKRTDVPPNAEAYIAGPPVMLREVQKVLINKGISQERIHHDPIIVQ